MSAQSKPVRTRSKADHHTPWDKNTLAPVGSADLDAFAHSHADRRAAHWHADITAARRLVLTTVVVAAAAAGAIEYAGLQIVERLSDTAVTSSFSQWGLGLARNLGGALGVGAGAAALAMLVLRSWKRPWRALASAFALGTAAFLVFLTFMVSLAT